MKLIRHLLAGSICVAVVVASPAIPPSGQAVNVGHDDFTFLRGPEKEFPVPDHKFDKADDFPSPDEREIEPVPDAGDKSKLVREEDQQEFDMEDMLDGEGELVFPGEEFEDEADTEHDFRKLSEENVAKETLVPPPPLLETVTKSRGVPGFALNDPKLNLRTGKGKLEL